MKNNYKYIIIFFAIAIVIGISIFLFSKNNSNLSQTSENNNTEVSRTSMESNNMNEVTNIDNKNYTKDNTNNSTNTDKVTDNLEPKPTPIEEDIAEFSTKIYSTKDQARQKNLEITSSKLNGTTVSPGATFSFTSTVGKATAEEGYQLADIYDENGNKIKGYGGGNCQISSTLYNAVLKLSSLKVTERHAHPKKVPYVKKGKDASVAYGSVDFKFVNNYDYSIKIYCSVDRKNVYVRIVKLS